MTEKDLYYAEYMCQPEKQSAALEQALENRGAEIDLYWRRTAYFWTLSAAILAGYFSLTSPKSPITASPNAALGIACFGFIVALSWFFANKGSKFWQENWENHVVHLANPEVGSLFQKIMHRPRPKKGELCRHVSYHLSVTAPKPISVTKINQWVSLYTVMMWLAIIVHDYPGAEHLWRSISPEHQYFVTVVLTLIFAVVMRVFSRTHLKGHSPEITFNQSKISN